MTRSIGFIGGGQMAEALIKGILQSGTFTADQIKVDEPLEQRRAYLTSTYQIASVASIQELIEPDQVLILAVKPQVMGSVLNELTRCYNQQLIITIAAGLPIAVYQEALGNQAAVVRVMPNMGALIQQGASALCRNQVVSDGDLAFAESLFDAVGTSVIVEEKLMDAVTGLSGSGPAYVFSFIEALVEGGVKAGLSRPVARELAVQTVLGAALCLKNGETHPAVYRDQVTSPGGTTASGLYQLEAGAFKATVMEAVEAATRRSRELGNK